MWRYTSYCASPRPAREVRRLRVQVDVGQHLLDDRGGQWIADGVQMAHVLRSLPGGVRERGLRRVHPRVPARRLVGLRWRVEQRENARHVDRRAMQRVAHKRLDIRERGQGLLTLERRRAVMRRHKLVEPCVRRHVRDPVRKDARSSDNVMHHTRRGRMQHEIEHRVAADVGRPRPGGGAGPVRVRSRSSRPGPFSPR